MVTKEHIAILGAGESGVGTAILATKLGYSVFVSDNGKIKNKYKEVLLNNKIDFEEAQHSDERIFNADVVMKSPGIPDEIPLIKQLKKRDISVVSEIEFASNYTQANIAGITGSNGKTTTTMMFVCVQKELLEWFVHLFKQNLTVVKMSSLNSITMDPCFVMNVLKKGV